jgi:hypothetical protein
MSRSRSVLAILLGGIALSGCGKDGLFGVDDDKPLPQKIECTTSRDCAVSEHCDDGVCVPDCEDCSEEPIMSIAGDWDSEYHLDWSDYLGPLADLGEPLDFLDQLLLGNSSLDDLPLLGSVLQSIIDTYIPDWVQDLVHFLNNMVHFFQDVRIEARLHLTQMAGNPAAIGATEQWDWAYVQIIDQCPYGESDPNYPACADFAVPLNFAVTGIGTIVATALPFNGSFDGTTVTFDDREVQMELSEFLRFILDWVTEVATGGRYGSLEGALTGIIDCNSVTAAIQNALCSSFNWCGAQPAVYAACVAARDEVVDQVLSAIDEVSVDWEVMRFDMSARAYDNPENGVADKLGNPPSAPGTIDDGHFRALVGADLTGTWSAVR